MADIAWYFIFIIIILALDWALFSQVRIPLESIYQKEFKDNYFQFIFPRVLITIAGSAAIAFSFLNDNKNSAIMIMGVAASLASLLFGLIKCFTAGRCRE